MNTEKQKSSLLQKWIIFTSENDAATFSDFANEFTQLYSRFLDLDYNDLVESSGTEESPHLTQHPEYILDKLNQQLKKCKFHTTDGFDERNLYQASAVFKCLVIICRNYDNISLVASWDFVKLAVTHAQAITVQLCSLSGAGSDQGPVKDLETFVKMILHLLECLYDPLFVWRKSLRGWTVDVTSVPFKPPLIHNEVIPFIYDCFQKPGLSAHLQLQVLNMFGAVMSGSQVNAILAVTPATLDILFGILSCPTMSSPTLSLPAQREIQYLTLRCITHMVHNIHTCSPDQRQVEIPEVIDGYLRILLGQQIDEASQDILVAMIDAIGAMISCNDKLALQVQLISDQMFEILVGVLTKSLERGLDCPELAKSLVRVLQALLSGCPAAKVMFAKSVGYTQLLDVLQKAGQPSKDLLQHILNLVVEGEYVSGSRPVIRNTAAVSMAVKWLENIKPPDLQIWLCTEIRSVCTCSYGNRMNCCTGGLVSVVLSLLGRHSKLQLRTVVQLICLLERLGSLSITSAELKHLIGLMKPDEDGKQFTYATRLMRCISTMARREGTCGPLHFFDIQQMADFISLPGIRKWPGPAFSFFTWLCLDVDPRFDLSEKSEKDIGYRRLLYSFSTSGGNGFEAFITPSLNLTVATFSKKDFSTVTVTDIALDDGLWHCVCVVHSPGRRFSNSVGSVAIYIDGKQRSNAALKFPNILEPFTNCKVGSPGMRAPTEVISEVLLPDGLGDSTKKKSPLKSLFSFAVGGRGRGDVPCQAAGVHTLMSGTQEDTWGLPTCLHGQMESVCVFHDALQLEHAKALSLIGPDSLVRFENDATLADLPLKLVARYSAKACKGNECADLSPYQNHGSFSGNRCSNWDIKDVINCLGGVLVLFPLLESLDQSLSTPAALEDSGPSPAKNDMDDLDLQDWVVTDRRPSSELRLEHNQLAAFITMLRYLLKEKSVNRDLFVRMHCAATLGLLMQKVPPELMDVNVLMSVQYLVEDCDDHLSTKSAMIQHIYHCLLFDFSLWGSTQFAVRIGHIQYLSTIIKDDRKYFRKKYGVQFFLDTIRAYYSSPEDSNLSEEDSKTIRVSLFNLIKYYIMKDITAEELSQLMGFILAVKKSTLLLEALDLVISLLDSRSRKQDQLILQLFEPEQGEMFYQLLTYPHQPIIFYEKVVKVLYLLLKSERVYDKSKARLRLTDIGHWGLINLMVSYDISAPMIKRFIEQVSFTDTPQMYSAVLAILGLVHNCGLDIKSEASRQVLALIVSKIPASKGFAKQLGWQENITRLITMERKRAFTSSTESNADSEGNVESMLGLEELQQEPLEQHQQQSVSKPGHTTASSSLPPQRSLPSSSYTSSNTLGLSAEPSQQLVDISTGAPSSSSCQADDLHGEVTTQATKTTQSSFNSAPATLSASPTRPSALQLSAAFRPGSLASAVPPLDSSLIGGDNQMATPHTPLYLRRRSNPLDELTTPEGEENFDFPQDSRSSSVSIEDLRAFSTATPSSSATDATSSSNGGQISSSASILSIASSLLAESPSEGFDMDSALGNSQTSMDTIESSQRHNSSGSLVAIGDEQRRNSSSSHLNSSTSSERRVSSVLKGESYKQVLDHVGVELTDALEQKEELCQNILIILLSIMWKGVDGSTSAVWKERCQVFTWIDELGESHALIRPPEEIKRRLMEMLLHNCTTDIRNAGQAIATQSENAIELVRLVQSFLTGNEASVDRFSIRLLEDVMALLDILRVWDTDSGLVWTEMVHRGISILLAFSRQSDLELVSAATVKLHSLVQTKLISSSAEASYILGLLNSMIMEAIQENSDNYAYLMPVLRALVDKGQELLTISVQLPHLPKTTMSPTFFDDFKTYVYSEEWQQFITNYINPQMTHFMESNFEEGTMTQFWSLCHEDMMMNHHRLNREIGESRLKFKSNIEEVFRKKVDQENRRFHNCLLQHRNQHLFALRQWRATKRFFLGDRGAWTLRHQEDVHWKLSNQENFARMKVKLTQNYNFEDHLNASRLRDNLGAVDSTGSLCLEELKGVKEALVSKEDLADDTLGDEEWSAIFSSSMSTEEYSGKEKLVMSTDCELVTVVEEVKGRLEVTTTHVYFFDCSSHRDEVGEDFKWALARLREIHFRRYNLRRSALEIFLIDQTNYFINFPEKRMRNKVYSCILSLRPQNLIYKGQRSPADLLRSSGLTQKWVSREISNFEYLMQLNTIAGRTYNDLSQYHVFPWILMDYTSKHLDLEDASVFRDLSLPIGAVNPKKQEEVREKYETFEDPSGTVEKFHYGTHYSNAASVMHYMVRVEPFTTLHIELQSGKFDVADRQFHSIPASFQSLIENPNDVKELIPEFFYFPEFLVNFNGFNLGKLQITKETVNDVTLPAWASTPEEFIYKHRQALESEHVSANLHNWIDLIFGYKQKGPAAVEALNIFYYVTYEGAVDLDAIQDLKERAAVEGMIRNFGQTPSQLLKEPHLKRMTFEEAVVRNTKLGKPMSVFHFLKDLKPFFVEVSNDLDPLVFVNVPRSQSRSILQQGMPDNMITLTEDGIVGVHGWLPFDKSIPNFYTFDRDATMQSPRTKKRIAGPFSPGLKVSAKLFMVSHDAKLLFTGGHWDNSLQVYSLYRSKLVNHIVRHIDIVTCLALDNCGRHLVTGSRDTTCMVWEIIQQAGVSTNLSPKPVQTLYGHDSEVTAVHISTELDLVISASKDGTVILHTVIKGHYTMTLRAPSQLGGTLDIPNMAVSDTGQIVLYCVEEEKQAGDGRSKTRERHCLHLYSVNGKHLFSDPLEHAIGDMYMSGDHLVVGNNAGQLLIMEIFGLRPVTTMELLVPIQCLTLTNGNSHILAGLKDGKLIIIGNKGKS